MSAIHGDTGREGALTWAMIQSPERALKLFNGLESIVHLTSILVEDFDVSPTGKRDM